MPWKGAKTIGDDPRICQLGRIEHDVVQPRRDTARQDLDGSAPGEGSDGERVGFTALLVRVVVDQRREGAAERTQDGVQIRPRLSERLCDIRQRRLEPSRRQQADVSFEQIYQRDVPAQVRVPRDTTQAVGGCLGQLP